MLQPYHVSCLRYAVIRPSAARFAVGIFAPGYFGNMSSFWRHHSRRFAAVHVSPSGAWIVQTNARPWSALPRACRPNPFVPRVTSLDFFHMRWSVARSCRCSRPSRYVRLLDSLTLRRPSGVRREAEQWHAADGDSLVVWSLISQIGVGWLFVPRQMPGVRQRKRGGGLNPASSFTLCASR